MAALTSESVLHLPERAHYIGIGLPTDGLNGHVVTVTVRCQRTGL
jgi:hypothetical protein